MSDNKNIVPMTYGEMGNFAKIVMQSRMFTSIQSTQQALLTMVAGREMGIWQSIFTCRKGWRNDKA